MADRRRQDSDYPWARIVVSEDTIVPHHAPFPLARRFHQICQAMLAEAVADQELPVPLQYSVLAVVDDFPGADQRRLAMLAGVDRTNIGQIIDGLAAKGLVERRVNGQDRRMHELTTTPRGRQVRQKMRVKMLAAQDRILRALKPAERVTLINLLVRTVEANEAYARPGGGRRAPRRGPVSVGGGTDDRERKASAPRRRDGSALRRGHRGLSDHAG